MRTTLLLSAGVALALVVASAAQAAERSAIVLWVSACKTQAVYHFRVYPGSTARALRERPPHHPRAWPVLIDRHHPRFEDALRILYAGDPAAAADGLRLPQQFLPECGLRAAEMLEPWK